MIADIVILVSPGLKLEPIRGRNRLCGKRKYLFRYCSTWPSAVFDKELKCCAPKVCYPLDPSSVISWTVRLSELKLRRRAIV